MKKGKVLKRLFPISLCAVLLILSVGCTSTTPTSTSVETIPLFLRYVDAANNQEQLLKLTWNTKTGTVEMDTSTTLMFPNYANESNFWVTLETLDRTILATAENICQILPFTGMVRTLPHYSPQKKIFSSDFRRTILKRILLALHLRRCVTSTLI